MNLLQFLLIALLRLYRWVVSPLKNFFFSPQGSCRFTPTCSQYAIEAVQRHGAWRGSWLALRRLSRCHPWGDCGHDPVPEPRTNHLRSIPKPPDETIHPHSRHLTFPNSL